MSASIQITVNCLIFSCFWVVNCTFSQTTKPRLYLLAGQDSDYRLFQKYNFERFDTTAICYITPEKGDDMATYARRLMAQMDTTQPFFLMASSLGGMLSCEMAKVKRPEKILMLAGAKCRRELPFHFRMQKYVPLYRLFGGRALKAFAVTVHFFLEPETRRERKVFRAMMHDKDPKFMTRGVAMIVNWNNTTLPDNIIHLHGSKDRVLPKRRVRHATIIKGASHTMALTRSAEIQPFLNLLKPLDSLDTVIEARK
jgi:pimeloyl-ACP methyl ester carboxylesterase